MNLSADIKEVARSNQRYLWLLLLLGLPLLYLLSGFYSIGPEHRGILTRFGKIISDQIMPGMHYHLPWPIESIEKIKVTSVRSMELELVEPSDESIQQELTTSDLNLIEVSLILQYNIESPGIFRNQAVEPEVLMRQIARSASIQYVATRSINDLLTTGRNQFQLSLQKSIQQQLKVLNLGIRITSVQIKALQPPASIRKVFDNVSAARSDKKKVIQEQQGNRSSSLSAARGEANSRIQAARAYVSEVMAQANGDSERLLSNWKEYRKAPELNREQLRLDTLKSVLSRAKLAILNPSDTKTDQTTTFMNKKTD
jgi:membrane protease subunit HflK